MAEASEKVAAFEVIIPATGHRYMIYPDGQVVGFGQQIVLINRIPRLVLQAELEGTRHG